MKYSERYIEFPVIITYQCEREDELDDQGFPTAETMLVNTVARINPLQIEGYGPDTDGGMPTGDESMTCTRVFMKSTGSHVVNMPINDFEKYLDDMYEKLYNQ